MTKFDKRADRPAPLLNATILPVSNGEYVILPGDGYHSMEEGEEPTAWPLAQPARELVSLPWKDSPGSESQALDMALASGLLHHFLGESELFLTIRGRLRSPSFRFAFTTPNGQHDLDVDGVQVEVDAGLEGEHLNLVEAKLGKRSDFHVRQLYYPVRMWQERQDRKPVRAVFVAYSNKVYSLRLYSFNPADNYSGLVLEKAGDYTFSEEWDEPTLASILEGTPLGDLPKVTFPQADDIEKVMDVVDAVAANVTSIEGLVDRYGFVGRQADYYRTAAMFLGFIEKVQDGFCLTLLGREFSSASRAHRRTLLLTRLANLPVFREALEYGLEHGQSPEKLEIASLIETRTDLSGSTLGRRASTVKSWVTWLMQHEQ